MEPIQITKTGTRWVARSSFAQKDVVKAAGFRWDRDRREWYTTDAEVAIRLESPEKMAETIAAKEAADKAKAESVETSRAADFAGEIPCPEGLAYLPYQRAGIAFAMARTNTLFGDEMGLGKTIQAIGVINTDETIRRVLVICPASLRLNWRRELQKWLVRPMTVGIAQGDSCPMDHCEILICNYDILERHKDRLKSITWDCAIVDEAHYLKNPEAKRTIVVCGMPGKKKKGVAVDPVPALQSKRKLFLTGTPIPNRPIEGFPIFNALDSEEFRSFWGYAKRYCDAREGRWGWDLTGSSNLPELQTKLRASIMVRRLKADVLTELPAKRRSVIELAANGAAAAIKTEQESYEAHEEALESLRARVELAKASDDPADYEEAVARLREAARVAFTEMSKVRHATAVAKVPYVVEHLRSLIEEGVKVVCFAHHKDVIAAIMAEFPGAVKITGDDAMEDRQASVDRFQSDGSCMLFVGNIQAAGVGLTLTASSHVVFAELDWVPGNVSQAEDRCHRIGQRNMVQVQHLVLEGSMDARMATTLVEKQRVIDEALDKMPEPEPVIPSKEQPATASASRKAIEEIAAKMTPEAIGAVHEALRILAGFDEDHAREQNGMGYSKADVMIGHSLADRSVLTPKQAALGSKLVRKYRRQLPAELVAVATAMQ